MLTEKEKNRYVRSVSSRLYCRAKAKAGLLKQFRAAVEEVEENTPDCSLENIEAALGQPAVAAENLRAEIPTKEFKSYKSKIIAAVSCALTVVMGYLLLAYFVVLAENSKPTHTDEVLVIYETSVSSEAETTVNS